MYSNFPQPISSTPVVTNNQIAFTIDVQIVDVPVKSDTLLLKLGWSHYSSHPDTHEQLYHKPPPNDVSDEVKASWDSNLQYSYWHWYEAMAYEFGKFMSIDDDSNG